MTLYRKVRGVVNATTQKINLINYLRAIFHTGLAIVLEK